MPLKTWDANCGLLSEIMVSGSVGICEQERGGPDRNTHVFVVNQLVKYLFT